MNDASDQSPRDSEYVLFYDGNCVMCNGFVKSVFQRDKSGLVRFSPIGGETYSQLLSQHREIQNIDSLILWQPAADIVHTHSTAALQTLRLLGGAVAFLARLSLLVPRPLRDFVYRLTAQNRYKVFGRYETCPIPPPALRARLLP